MPFLPNLEPRKEKLSKPRIISLYLIVFIGILIDVSLIYFYTSDGAAYARFGGLVGKTDHYKMYAHHYNLLFLGDSRTYCGIQPEYIDSLMGTHSLNLSLMSHWFPTQYAQFKDIVDFIPKGTTVVWSIGHQNFNNANGIRRVYPVGLVNLRTYLDSGFKWSELKDNILYYNPVMHFFHRRGEFRKMLMAQWEEIPSFLRKKPTSLGEANSSLKKGEQALIQKAINSRNCFVGTVKNFSHIDRIDVQRDADKITSVILYKKQGSYHRIEIDRSFFRNKQKQLLEEAGGELFGEELELERSTICGDVKYFILFEQMLELFAKREINLIVNEFQEAPYSYRSPILRQAWATFMQDSVKPIVERYGFEYITVDFKNLKDEHYFDFNHLNDKGIALFTPMLVQKLNEIHQRRGR